MSRINLISALSISIVLVGGALWFRLAESSVVTYTLTAIESGPEEIVGEEIFLKDFLSAPATSQAISDTPLTKTDLVSRQIFSDYISLSADKSAGAGVINTLANKYADDILNETEPVSIQTKELIIVPDSEANLANYGSMVMSIRNKYKNLAAAQHNDRNLTDINSPSFESFMSNASLLYQRAAAELLAVKAPVSLALNHAALVSNYRTNMKAMQILATISSDPIRALTALNTYTKNTREEDELLMKIQATLLANGIIFDNSI